jgi:hypothetical protein
MRPDFRIRNEDVLQPGFPLSGGKQDAVNRRRTASIANDAVRCAHHFLRAATTQGDDSSRPVPAAEFASLRSPGDVQSQA